MHTHLSATLAFLLAFLLAGCATSGVPPLRAEFGDIPLLEGLTYRPDESLVIETPSVRVARLLYRGRMEPGSAIVEMQKGLEANGWRLLRSTSVGRSMLQVFEKGESSLQVKVWESGAFNYYTYVELSGTRPASSTATTAAKK